MGSSKKMTMTTAADEVSPLLSPPEMGGDGVEKRGSLFSAANRILVAGFLISIALSFTQVPILYAFRTMECEKFYQHHAADMATITTTTPVQHDRCSRSEIDAGTARQVSILGMSTTFCGILNLFFSGWQINNWGPRRALVVQTAFPAVRVAIQALGVHIGAGEGIVIVQCSQIIGLVGGMSGYLLALNTAVGAESVTASSQRTAMFGMLQGAVMLGTSIGYLLGGIVGDAAGIIVPFEVATLLFSLSSAYSALVVPYIDPKTLAGPRASSSNSVAAARQSSSSSTVWSKLSGGLKVLQPATLRLADGNLIRHAGITFLALGVFVGVLATGYAPILIQMYATAAFAFASAQNGYLMASNSAIRGLFLMFVFPKIIAVGRARMSSSSQGQGQAFDLFFLRWSLVMDGLVTASTAFATQGWHIYLAGLLLPLASGSAPAAKGVITEMCDPSERPEALQAMTLVENVAMLSTLGLFGFIFSAFSDTGQAYLTFYCNAGVAMVAVAILFLSHFPPQGSTIAIRSDRNFEDWTDE